MTGCFQNINYDLDKLPAMPAVAAEMVQLMNSTTSSANQLADVVAKDSVVAVRVLKIANSSFYSMSRKVTTLPTAIVVLGERTLRNLVLAVSMRHMHQSFGKVEKILWEDSMVCALGSRYLAQRLGLADPEEAFMAGLFRHIGKVVQNSQEGKMSDQASSLITAESDEALSQERDMFGATHGEIGAAVLEQWQLSEIFSLVALQHMTVDLGEVADPETRNLICLVNIAGEFSALFGIIKSVSQPDLTQTRGAQALQLDQGKLADFARGFGVLFKENRDDFLS